MPTNRCLEKGGSDSIDHTVKIRNVTPIRNRLWIIDITCCYRLDWTSNILILTTQWFLIHDWGTDVRDMHVKNICLISKKKQALPELQN